MSKTDDHPDISIRSDELIGNDGDKKCAPGIKFENGSCMSLNILIEMAGAYNADNPGDKIKLYPNFETLNRGKYKKYLLHQFKKRLTQCNTQHCWTTQPFVKKMKRMQQEELQKNTYRPAGPSSGNKWLNTININDSMKQYENVYPEFKFLGSVPIDFDDIPELGIRDLDFKKLIDEGKTKLGIVFNTDESTSSGEHWISCYADIKEGKIYFWDSYSTPPEHRIRKFMRRVANFCKENNGKEPVVDHNRVRHQFGNSECGVYSMRFILNLLKGETFENVCNNPIPDKVINKCRKIYFK